MPGTVVHTFRKTSVVFTMLQAFRIFNLSKYRLLQNTYTPVSRDLNIVLRLSLEKQLYLYFVNLALGLCHFWEALEH